ncbi:LuxR C-terminal-related transcriptional regulator [Ktedonospora formicarum]|uniref:HTH luxR-type domain-containing protein n=1 Tax=Ktedonospora formicarum TaxID=2778364 RepID=A0A8J3I503_9CHLR|nr:LuxR C-terminal-related transcriptional regulator [Ktedonospora formicarum]GHO46770.1 hypothetical protein KSX_49330 [Ktedonospora formicarum]
MSRSSLHILAWSTENQRYKLSTRGQQQQSFSLDEDEAWRGWLSQCVSFSFQGRYGNASVVKEARSRGAGYWYAYSTRGRRTGKCYLGPDSRVTLARLEEVAQSLAQTASPLHDFIPDEPSVTREATLAPSIEPLLATKLSPPHLPSTLVEREALHLRMEEALARPLVLLSASAGWGKTTLLSSWATQTARDVAWLTLDELDNDPTRFWSAVITALRSLLPDVGASALAMLRTPQPPRLSVIVTTLLNELNDLMRQAVFVFDDYHLIEEQAIHGSLLFFLEHLPQSLSLVLASRIDPPLPLARLRVRGQMSEFRDMDLRFQRDEVARFLVDSEGLPLSKSEVTALERRTEGWIAGLQLAALTLRQRSDHAAFVQNFTGSQRYILDYLQEEVMNQLPPPLQNFLLRSSILTRLNASLCEAVTAEPESRKMLATIERSNLFLIALDEERHWYRFHDLFREMLLTHLRASQPELVPTLHERATRWYEAQGALPEAIRHALAINDLSSAAELMEKAAESIWLAGGAKIVLDWIVLLPEAVLRQHLNLGLTAALHMLHKLFGAPEEYQSEALVKVEQIISRAERLLHDDKTNILSPAEREQLKRRVRLFYLWSYANKSILAGDIVQLSQQGQQMQDLAIEEEMLWQLVPLFVNVILSLNSITDFSFLMPMLLKARKLSEHEQKVYAFLRIGQWLAQLSYETGQLREARRIGLETLNLLEYEDIQALSIKGYIHLTLARIYWSWGQREEAQAQLQAALEHARTWQYLALNLDAHNLWLQFSLDESNVVDAEQALHVVEQNTQQQITGLYIPDMVSTRVRLWLAQGNIDSASDWAAQRIQTTNTYESALAWEEDLILARVYLSQQRYTGAQEILTALVNGAERGGRINKLAQALALQVVAFEGQNESEQAMQTTTRLLRLTEPEGYIRVYLDAGELMARVLQRLLAPEGSYARLILPPACITMAATLCATFEQGRIVEEPVSSAITHNTTSTQHTGYTSQGETYEPLSPQEQKVLHLLIEGKTYAEIAQTLIVSPNTVKTQVSSIYRKLNVSRRAEAIRAAQHLNLL